MNHNENIFFKRFDGAVRKVFFEDKSKYMVLSWIIFRTNYQEEYQGLRRNECYFSYSIVENECNVSRKKLQKILLDLEKNGFIRWTHKSKGKDSKSVIYLIEIGYGSENGLKYGSENGKNVENTNVTGNKDTVKDTIEDTVKDTSSRNISKNISRNKSNIYSPNSNEFRLASYLFNFIKRNNPNAKEPNLQKWSKQFDYILRIDERDIEEVKSVIKWCQNDNFWFKNILSPDKLRKQYDRLLLEVNKIKNNNSKQSNENWKEEFLNE